MTSSDTSRRALCLAADIKGWSSRPVPEQIRAQQALVTVACAACREAGLPAEIVQRSGDGVLVTSPSDIDESQAIPDLVRGFRTALYQENRMLADGARIRLRVALTNGPITPGPAGLSGNAVVECFRLLDSKPVRQALADFPLSELAVIVSDQLYHEVVEHGFRDLRPEDFWQADSSIPEKNFQAWGWVYVSDRGGAPVPAPAEAALPAVVEQDEVAAARARIAEGRPEAALKLLAAAAAEPDSAAVLDVRADALLLLGDYEEADAVLGRLIRIEPRPGTEPTLQRWGRCKLLRRDYPAAESTLGFLLTHYPDNVEGHLDLGLLAVRAKRSQDAHALFVKGLGLAIEREPMDRDLLRRFHRSLAELPG